MNESTPAKATRQTLHSFPDITPILSSGKQCDLVDSVDVLPGGSSNVTKRKLVLNKPLKKKKTKSDDLNAEVVDLDVLFLPENDFVIDESAVDSAKKGIDCNKAQSEDDSGKNKSEFMTSFASVPFLQDKSDSQDIFLNPADYNLTSDFGNDSIFEKVPVIQTDRNQLNPPVTLEKHVPNEELFSGLSKVFTDKNDFSLNCSNKEADISELFKNKLLQNASNAAVVASKSTGWTQFKLNFEDSLLLESLQPSYELGPYYGLPISVRDLIQKHKGITELYGK